MDQVFVNAHKQLKDIDLQTHLFLQWERVLITSHCGHTWCLSWVGGGGGSTYHLTFTLCCWLTCQWLLSTQLNIDTNLLQKLANMLMVILTQRAGLAHLLNSEDKWLWFKLGDIIYIWKLLFVNITQCKTCYCSYNYQFSDSFLLNVYVFFLKTENVMF